jgi:hypothetical protein
LGCPVGVVFVIPIGNCYLLNNHYSLPFCIKLPLLINIVLYYTAFSLKASMRFLRSLPKLSTTSQVHGCNCCTSCLKRLRISSRIMIDAVHKFKFSSNRKFCNYFQICSQRYYEIKKILLVFPSHHRWCHHYMADCGAIITWQIVAGCSGGTFKIDSIFNLAVKF